MRSVNGRDLLTVDPRDQVALVTGGGRGIGAAAEEIAEAGGKAVVVGAEAADPGQVAAAFGGLHVLVNNAGI